MVKIRINHGDFESIIKISGTLDDRAIETIKAKSKDFLEGIRHPSKGQIQEVILDFQGVDQVTAETEAWFTTMSAFVSSTIMEGRKIVVKGVDRSVLEFLEKSGLTELIRVTSR